MSKETHLRQLREQAAMRRLELAKLVRADPKISNIALAAKLGVTRNTVAIYRKENMDELHKSNLGETEQGRLEMLEQLKGVIRELELHRKDGKLPVAAIHEFLLVTKSMVELLGVRKPVTERLEVRKSTVQFRTFIGKKDQGVFTHAINGRLPPKVIEAEFETDKPQLEEGEPDGEE